LSAGRVRAAELTFSCHANNDLFKLIEDSRRYRITRVETPVEAVERAADGSGALLLADGYPRRRTPVTPELLALARRKKLRLYLEYPSEFPGLKFGETRTTQWERGVVASDFFGGDLPKLRIVAPHDCHFLPVTIDRAPHLVVGRVAGYDTAVYGLAKESFPLLFDANHDGTWLIATTKLSNFVTARFAPAADWKVIWRTILQKLDPWTVPPLDFTPVVRPAYAKDAPLPKMIERDTFNRAADFYLHSGLLIPPDRKEHIRKLLVAGQETEPRPAGATPPGATPASDGTLGMLEGYASAILHTGGQLQRTPIRADCNAEAAMVLALDAMLNPNTTQPSHSSPSPADTRTVATNLLDYTFGPEMQSLGRLDPAHPAFGLIAWGAISPAWQVANYGDDNARVLLAAILASSAMNTDRWDEHLLRGLLANLRTTGRIGFRGDRVDIGPLEQHGWRHFHDAQTVNFSPHFESGLWACYLWAYARTGEREFLDRTTTAIGMTMDAYAKTQWRWNDNMERSRMLLCLAWLVRVDDKPKHRAWLDTIATDLLGDQHPCGAIADRLANAGGGHYQIPQSNEAYGTTETPLIQSNGDPVSDQLYTAGFALLGLHEAFAATADAKLKSAEDRLAAYLCRIQVRSEKLPYLDGAWFRAFDFGRWDFWASSADLGWGAWSVEAGWGPAWTAATLALREKQTTFWDITAASRAREQLPKVHADMKQNTGGPWKP
jgi:hypothetical protein